MTAMLKYILLILCLPSISFTGREINSSRLAVWVITKGGSLKVNGSTNVNDFCCEITGYSNPDTIVVYKNAGQDLILPVTGVMTLAVSGFDCHNSFMTKDLRKTLKEPDYPKMFIRFLTLNREPDFRFPGCPVTGLVDIELAGVTRRYEMNYSFTMDNQKTIHLTGSRAVNFSDFNLIPPRKLGGMIRTKERLDVSFQLNMKVITTN
jgi:hypothetical protein